MVETIELFSVTWKEPRTGMSPKSRVHKKPKRIATKNTPAVPKLTPLMVMPPRRYPSTQIIKAKINNTAVDLNSTTALSSVSETVILLLFRKFFSGKVVFRVIYIFAILLPAIFPTIATSMIDTPIYEFLEEITESVYDKGQGGLFSGRVEIFSEVQLIIAKVPFMSIFGYGQTMVSFFAAHNGYYLLHYTFGLIGTLVIAGALIYFFEINYKLIKSGDNVAFGCFAILISVLYQQSSEGWFLGSYLLTLMPFVYMAIVIGIGIIYAKKANKKNPDYKYSCFDGGFYVQPVLTYAINDNWRFESTLNFMGLNISGSTKKESMDKGDSWTKSSAFDFGLSVLKGDYLTVGFVYSF